MRVVRCTTKNSLSGIAPLLGDAGGIITALIPSGIFSKTGKQPPPGARDTRRTISDNPEGWVRNIPVVTTIPLVKQ